MVKNEIGISVNCNLCVDRSTAETCLKLVEIYINSNSGVFLEKGKNQDGKQTLTLIGGDR